jgi:hypothetical protein
MDDKQKGILIFVGIAALVFISVWKSVIDKLGLTGSATNMGISAFLHHSRWGTLMVLISGIIFYMKKKQGYYLAWVLLVIGSVLIIQHLSTEQCFSVVGGLC